MTKWVQVNWVEHNIPVVLRYIRMPDRVAHRFKDVNPVVVTRIPLQVVVDPSHIYQSLHKKTVRTLEQIWYAIIITCILQHLRKTTSEEGKPSSRVKLCHPVRAHSPCRTCTSIDCEGGSRRSVALHCNCRLRNKYSILHGSQITHLSLWLYREYVLLQS